MWRLGKALIWVVLLFSGYWVAAAQLVQTGAGHATDALAKDGIVLDIGAVTTTGYPARFDTVLTNLRLVHADWAWQGQQIVLHADSYRPLAVDLTFPQEQTITVAGQVLQVTSDSWQANASVRPTAMMSFDSGSVAMGQTSVVADAGWQLGLGSLVANLVHAGGRDARYDADLVAERIDLPAELHHRLDPADQLGAQVTSVSGAASLTLAHPLDRGLQGRLPDIDHVALHDLRLDWGPVTAELTGDIAVDAQGIPAGQITLRTGQWRMLIAVLTSAGVIDAGVAETVTRLAGFMAAEDGMLTVPVAFQDGVTLVGMVPVGPAPRLR